MAQSIDRALSLVELAADRPLSLTEAATRLGVHKSTALRMLQSLEAKRFVRRTAGGAYVLGTGLIELAQQALGSIDLRQVAHSALRELQRETGHTVHLAQLIGDEVVYVDKMESPTLDSVQIHTRIGRAVSLYASGVGKVVLAFRPPEERARLLEKVELIQHTPTTFAAPTMLESEFSRIRDRGWGTDDGELLGLVNCIAAPIYDSRAEVMAAVSLTTMKVLAPLPQLVEHLPLLLEAAATVSREIGYAAP